MKLNKPSRISFLKLSAVAGLMTAVAVTSVAAATLTDAEKVQKRQELESYFSKALSLTKPESAKKAYQAFRFSTHGSTRIGYDSNVDLDNLEDGDTFYETGVGAKAEYSPEGAAIAGFPVAVGVRGHYDYLGYFDRDDMNRQSAVASPYLRMEFAENLFMETSYDFRAWLYDNRDDLSYLSHAGNVSMTHRITPNLSQKAEFTYEHLDYSDRGLLLSNGNFSQEKREDDRYEGVYGLRYRVGKWTFGAEGVWTWNDSNDNYFNYNDYQDAGLDVNVAMRVTERLIWSGFGGWRSRMYDSRRIAPLFTTVQDDDWFYAGTRLFYAINTWAGVDATFTYYENNSNDPTHEYGSTITSVGFHLYF